jgi:hypothetical protein
MATDGQTRYTCGTKTEVDMLEAVSANWREWGAILAQGKAVQYYKFTEPLETVERIGLQCDVWYTERNGDPIAMLVPVGTPPSELPRRAMSYHAIVWENLRTGECFGLRDHGYEPCDAGINGFYFRTPPACGPSS